MSFEEGIQKAREGLRITLEGLTETIDALDEIEKDGKTLEQRLDEQAESIEELKKLVIEALNKNK